MLERGIQRDKVNASNSYSDSKLGAYIPILIMPYRRSGREGTVKPSYPIFYISIQDRMGVGLGLIITSKSGPRLLFTTIERRGASSVSEYKRIEILDMMFEIIALN